MDYKKYQVKHNNIEMVFYDVPNNSTEWIIHEIFTQDTYQFEKMQFSPDTNIVIDIGANIGIFSTYLAKRFPQVKIYAFEPFPISFHFLCKNIKENQITNIIPVPLAITADRRRIYLYAAKDNLGGANSYVNTVNTVYAEVSSITLDDIFRMFDLASIRMLKIDCEGGEYEILPNSNRLIDIDYLVGEFHYLYGQQRDPMPLVEFCKQYFTKDKMQIKCY